MLTAQSVLSYVKRMLGYPYSTIEILDDDFISHWKEISLHDFSVLCPEIISIKLNDSNVVERISNKEWLIHDPEGRDIINVHKAYSQNTSGAEYGIGSIPNAGNAISFDGFEQVANNMLNAKMGRLGGDFAFDSFITLFEHPNKVIFEGHAPVNGTLQYKRVHIFESIPVTKYHYIRDLCLADAKILLGAVRKNMSSIPTPIGNIEISNDFASEGETLRSKVIEDLNSLPPDIIIEIGGN